MAELPEDVVTDILTRLPVKSLLRFRSVSKPFLSLIDSPDFIKRHLNRSLLTKTNRKLIILGRYPDTTLSDGRIYSVDLNALDLTLELDHPCRTGELGFLGAVNGILCLINGEPDIYIWNFATRNYRKLPFADIEFPGVFCVEVIAYGFGYDSESDDYKLLRLVQFCSDDLDSFYSEAKVYSLRSNSWQRIQDFPYYHCYGGCCGELICGALHWVVSDNRHSDITPFIVAFDLATNEYKFFDRPEFFNKGLLSVVKLEERLCVLHIKSFEQVDLWEMKNYGVIDSWSKLFSISPSGVIGSHWIPLAYSKNAREIMLVQNNRKLLWYSLKEGTAKQIYIRGCPDTFLLPAVCVESLVPLSGKAKDYAKKWVGGGERKKQIVKKKRDGFLSQGFKLKL